MTETLLSLEWREPLWGWLALFPWMLWGVRGLLQNRSGNPCADRSLLPWAQAQSVQGLRVGWLWRHALVALAWLLFALALSGPRVVQEDFRRDQGGQLELMLVFDLSRSMTARDVLPGRLERARLELETLLTGTQRRKIGLVVYAARPHLMTPLTGDMNLLRHDLGLLRHGLLPTEGSDLQAALAFASEQFSGKQAPRALLLITDGETAGADAAAGELLQTTLRQLAGEGIRIHVLGTGTTAGAPLQTSRGEWLTREGEPVLTVLQEQRLKMLAQVSGGIYANVSDGSQEWRALLEKNLRSLAAVDGNEADSDLIHWKELYSWFLLPAVLLLLLSRVSCSRESLMRQVAPVLLLGIWQGIVPQPVQAGTDPWQQSAYQAYMQQSYLEARKAYARVSGYAGRMGEGNSAYQLGEYAQAAALFTQAVLDADTDLQRARALFNLANAHYRRQDYDAAVAVYREVLRYDPKDSAARVNLGLAISRQTRQAEEASGGSGRQGRGPRSARLADDIHVGDGRLSIDEESQPPVIPRKSSATAVPEKEQDLLENSIYYSQPVVSTASDFEDTQWQYAATTEEGIELRINTLEVDESRFWQRLFEQEEGYPAPVDAPRELPGVPPW